MSNLEVPANYNIGMILFIVIVAAIWGLGLGASFQGKQSLSTDVEVHVSPRGPGHQRQTNYGQLL